MMRYIVVIPAQPNNAYIGEIQEFETVNSLLIKQRYFNRKSNYLLLNQLVVKHKSMAVCFDFIMSFNYSGLML